MTNLIDRYIAATNDGFPSADQSDVEREVRAALEDMTEAKMAEGLERESAERAAIIELGDPVAFAQQFRRSPRYLIGPKLFVSWWFVLRTVLLVVVPIAMGIELLGALINQEHLDTTIGEVLGAGFGAATQIAFWVTIIFAILEAVGGFKSGESDDTAPSRWTIDDLPDAPAQRQIGVGDLVLQCITIGLFAYVVIRLVTDRLGAFGLHRWLDLDPGTPFFNPALSEVWLVGFVALIVVNLLVVIWTYVAGYWNQRVTLAYLLVSVVWIVYMVALAGAGPIVNPDIQQSEAGRGSWSIVGENANTIIVAIIILITVWDAWEAIKGHWDYRKARRAAMSLPS